MLVVSSLNESFYLLNSANANTGIVNKFYSFTSYTDTDAIGQFRGFSYGGGMLFANFKQYIITFPLNTLLSTGLIAPTSMLASGGLSVVGPARFDPNTNLTFVGSSTLADATNNGRFVQSYMTSDLMPSSFSVTFANNDVGGLAFFDTTSNISYYLSARKLVVVNTTSRTATVIATTQVISFQSSVDKLVVLNGYACVISGCVAISTGVFTFAPVPAAGCSSAGALVAIGNYLLASCGGNTFSSSEVMGYTYQPGFQTYTTYGNTDSSSSRQLVVFGNQTLCGTASNSYLECYTLGNSTRMSTSNPFRVYSNILNIYNPITMSWQAAFVGANASGSAVPALGVAMNPWTGYPGIGFTLNETTISTFSSTRFQATVAIGTGDGYGNGVAYVLSGTTLTAISGLFNLNTPPSLQYISRNIPTAATPLTYSTVVPAPYVTPQGALVYITTTPNQIAVFNAFSGKFAYFYNRTMQSVPTQVAGSQLFLVSSVANGMFVVSLDLVSGTPNLVQSYPGSANSLGIVGFSVRNGPSGTALVSFVQENAYVQASFPSLPSASPVFPGGAPSPAGPVTAAAEKKKLTVGGIIGIVAGVLVVMFGGGARWHATRKSSIDTGFNNDYVPMNPAVQV